ncbi:FeoB-associated Cys-rich membrane protein [Fournierella massiliensis]|uniref:FeoB-associated Cys-rich membrane protein n=1 Tax=Allofournierella massiliensis TaxID=1650663 RepID=UPI003522F24A
MNLPTILVLVIVVVCFVAALVFICKNGGFGGECTGDCSSCSARCEAAKQQQNADKH